MLFTIQWYIQATVAGSLQFHQTRYSSRAFIPAKTMTDLDLLDEEGKTVTGRIRDCLVATNLSEYFMANGYVPTAETNAGHILNWLRQIIPNFESSYDLPCWRMSFSAFHQPPSSENIHNVVKGTISGESFSFDEDSISVGGRDTLHDVHWTGEPPHITRSVACLPKVFLLGYPKCGSSFLYCLLQTILSLKLNVQDSCEAIKEPHWWVGRASRHKVQSTTLGYLALYLVNFERASALVQRNLSAITIDASPNLMFQWPRYSQNETMENYCLLPSLIPVILPDSKYFVVMRNPITMLYSAFWWSCTRLKHQEIYPVRYKGPDIFHERVTKKITVFNKCKSRGTPLDICVDMLARNMFTPELPTCGRTRLEMGLYYFHTRKWLSVVPRERIHFFTLEELATKDLQHTVGAILNHIGLVFTEGEMQKLEKYQCSKNQQLFIDYKHDSRLKMREDTKQILEEFFQPYNQMLADLLGDDRFLWK